MPPLVSIITVTYQAAAVLERTLQSVLAQTYPRIEYLIIDGASTDGTLDIIRRYTDRLAYWHSEPDAGLYDAMNKGLQRATGEYIWFMNAGDEIYAADTLAQIFADYSPETDVYYGDALFVGEGGQTVGLRSQVTPHPLPRSLSWQSFRYGMVVCHQSFVVRRRLAPLYNLKHRYSADVDWEIRCLKNARSVRFTGLTLSRYLTGGFSRQHLQSSLKDRFRVLAQHFGALPTLVAHGWIALRGAAFVIRRGKGY